MKSFPMPLGIMTFPTSQNELDALRKLDPQAIGAVYDRYFPDVYRFVRYRLSDETTAEDIASEVFVRLLEAVKSGQAPQTSLKAWLLGTASHGKAGPECCCRSDKRRRDGHLAHYRA